MINKGPRKLHTVHSTSIKHNLGTNIKREYEMGMEEKGK